VAKVPKRKAAAPLPAESVPLPGASPEEGARADAPRPDTPLPGWVPPVLFLLFTVALFRSFIFSDGMLFGSDTISLGYMAREFYAEAVRSGDFPLWNPYLLGGVPFLEALSGGDSLYPPGALPLFIMETHRALGWKLILHVFAAGMFMYGWTRALGVSRGAALVAGTGWLFAPVMVTLVFPGHDGKIFVSALTPLLFWAMESTFGGERGGPLRRRSLLAYAGVAGVVALVILTTHFQMAYFLFGAAGLYYAFRCFELTRAESAAAAAAESEPASGTEARPGPQAPISPAEPLAVRTPARAPARFALFLMAALVGAATAGIQLIPAVGYVTDSSRRTATTTAATPAENKEYAAQWSLHPEEVVSLVVPEFIGSNAGGAGWATDTYWGRNVLKTNHEYVGLVVLLLAGISFFGARRRGLRLFLVVLGWLALLYALGANTRVWHLAYAFLPGVRLFRAASMVAFLTSFAAVTLSAFGVDRLRELAGGDDPKAARGVCWLLWVSTGLLGVGFGLALAGVLDEMWTGVMYPGITEPQRGALALLRPYLTFGLRVATVLAAATAALATAAMRWRRVPTGVLVGTLVALVALDLWRVDAPFIETVDPTALITPDAIAAELVTREATEPPFRVHMVGADQEVRPATFGIPLAGGHHPNDLARYRELLGMVGSGEAANLVNPNLLSILAVKYMIWPTARMGGEPQDLEVLARSSLGGDQIYESLLAYPGLPRARLVGSAEVVPDDRAVARIMAPEFDVARVVTLTEPPPIELIGAADPGTVTWTANGIDRQRFSVEATAPALLVVADNWYPAWRATVDGVETPVLRANHTLRAVPVGPGTHRVEMWYDGGVLLGGAVATVAGLLAIGAMVGFALTGRERDAEPA
jgi:hypothetical protein